MTDMNNKIALVTGGASGIGKAMVKAFAKRGCTVIIFDVQDDKGQTLCDELTKQGEKTVYRHVNLFEIKEIKEAYQWIKETYGRIDYAMNNAGFGIPAKPLHEVTDEELNKCIGICLIALTRCMIEEVKMMLETGFGRIVNTTSGAGLLGSQGNAVYAAAKHGVVGITQSAALDYARNNMTVNAIAPGATETELVASLEDVAPDAYEQCLKANPAGKMAQPEDMANVAVFLCEDASHFINGVTIPVDSGFCAGSWHIEE